MSAPFTRPTIPELDLKSGTQRPRLLTFHESKSARLEREALKAKKENTQREALRLSLAVTISKKQASPAKSSKKKGKKGKKVKIVEKVKPEMLSPRITKVVPFRDPGEKKKPIAYNMLERLPGFRKSTDEGIDAILAPDSPIGSPIGTPKRAINKFYPRGSNRAIHLSKKKKGEEAMIKRSKAGALNLQHKMMGDNYVYAAVKAIILELQRDETDVFKAMYRTPSEIELDNIRMYDSAEDSSDGDEYDSSNAVSPLLSGPGQKNKNNKNQGVVSRKNTNKMNRGYMATAESIKYHNNTERFMVKEVNLRDNRMTDRGICRVLQDICKCAEITDNFTLLDLSENNIRKNGADMLSQVLMKSCNLEKLVLEKTQISNIVMKAMQSGLAEGANTCLLHLNLSHNEILDAGCIIIADILVNEDCQLRELDLSWNKIQDRGAVAIFTALTGNKQMLKLDLSWNAVGTKSEKTYSVSTALADMLQNNSSLIHLDLSQNQLSTHDCSIISEGLKANHSLLGFHMTGNQAQVDSYGYLMPEASPWPLESGHVMSRILNTKVKGQEKWMLRNSCWICGYYREHEFKYILTLSGMETIMSTIMNDTAQLAVYEAKRKAIEAKEQAASKKAAAAEAQGDPFAAMFATMSTDSAEEQRKAEQQKEEEALQSRYAYPVLPSIPVFVDCSVKLCTSFDKWVPEEMVTLRVNTEAINKAVNTGKIRSSSTASSKSSKKGYTKKSALENRALYGEEFQKYPYAMRLMDLYRVQASEEDAKAIALDSLQFSLRTKRREHSAATSATASVHPSIHEINEMEAVTIERGEIEGTSATASGGGNNNEEEAEAQNNEFCVEIVDSVDSVEEVKEGELSVDGDGEGDEGNLEVQAEVEGEKEEKGGGDDDQNEEGEEGEEKEEEEEEVAVELHRSYGLDEEDNDEYRADPSRPNFNLHRMVPPGVHYYGFRINNGSLKFDPYQPHVRTSTLAKLGLSFPKDLVELGLPKFLNTTTVHPLTKTEKLRGPPAMYTDIKPRIKNDDMADAKKYWTFNDSLFFNHNTQHQEAWQNRCFAKDWGYTKTSKGKSTNEVNALEILLRKHFQMLKNVYTHYSCLYSSEIFFMAQGAFNEFNTSCNILEVVGESSSGTSNVKGGMSVEGGPMPPSMTNKSSKAPSLRSMKGNSFKNADNTVNRNDVGVIGTESMAEDGLDNLNNMNASVSLLQESVESIAPGPSKTSAGSSGKPGTTRTELELIFVSACITGPRHEYNSKRALTRFQFLDALVQISNVKFVKTGRVSNLVDAVEKLILEHIEPFAERDDPEEFRKKYLYTESCDDVLRKNYEPFEKIFAIFSGEENTPLEAKSMCFREWTAFCDRGKLAEELLAERMMKLAYVRSKFCYADVFDESNAFKQMSFLEFLEAVIRCALSMHKAQLQVQLAAAEESMLLENSNSLVESVDGVVPADLGLNSLSTLSAEGLPVMDEDGSSLKSRLEVDSVKEFAYVVDSIAKKRYTQGKATKQKK